MDGETIRDQHVVSSAEAAGGVCSSLTTTVWDDVQDFPPKSTALFLCCCCVWVFLLIAAVVVSEIVDAAPLMSVQSLAHLLIVAANKQPFKLGTTKPAELFSHHCWSRR